LTYSAGVVILETHAFTRRIIELLPDEEYARLQSELVARPDVGRVIRGTGGLRKIRWAAKGHGKRGGVRAIYYWYVRGEQLLMLLVYPKGEQENLTERQRRALKKIIEDEYP
jgi:hypothetical protein